ncbi:MAG: hypothetical protein ACI9FJ_001039 [Alteromonadaceae bacterium]
MNLANTVITEKPWQALVDIYVAPSAVFNKLQQTPNLTWMAFILIMAMHFVSYMIFYGRIDPEWVVQQQLAVAGELTGQDKEALISVFKSFAQYAGVTAGILATLATLVISLCLAGYYMLVGNGNGNVKVEFNHWFAFAIWTQLPIVFKVIGLLMLFILSNEGDIRQELMSYSSLNQVFGLFEQTSSLHRWANSIDLFYIWQIILATVGLHCWCQFSMTKAVGVAAVPYIVVFGFMSLFLY